MIGLEIPLVSSVGATSFFFLKKNFFEEYFGSWKYHGYKIFSAIWLFQKLQFNITTYVLAPGLGV
jgi:hypothetical protein